MSAAISLADAQAQLAAWLAASLAVARNQVYEINTGSLSRRVTRADAAEIRQQITFWEAKVQALSPLGAGGRRRIRYVVPE